MAEPTIALPPRTIPIAPQPPGLVAAIACPVPLANNLAPANSAEPASLRPTFPQFIRA